MSVATQIERIKANIAAAYEEARGKGAAIPETPNSGNLPAAIASIPAGGLPEGVYTVEAEADPPECGTVSGGGVASKSMTVTLRVTANAGKASDYRFNRWTVNGLSKGTGNSCSITVNQDVKAVAEFLEYDWKTTYLPYSGYWMCMAYGGGKFVTLDFGGTGTANTGSDKAAYSADGIAWEAATMPFTAKWRNVTYGDGKFVAVASGSGKGVYSTDGIHWQEMTLPSALDWRSVAYGDGKFIAVAYGSNKAAYSGDGVTWTEVTLPANDNWCDVAYGGGKFVAVAYNSSKGAAYSTDGITWTKADFNRAYWSSMAYGNGMFVAVPSNGMMNYSEDGIKWEYVLSIATGSYYSIAYGGGKFIAIRSGGEVYTTEDLTVSWGREYIKSGKDWRSLAYGDGQFAAVAYNSNLAAYRVQKLPEDGAG